MILDSDGQPMGPAEVEELARACAEIWLMAVRLYYAEAGAAMRGVKSASREALDDLTSDRRLLAALLEPLDACPQRVGDAFIGALDSGLAFSLANMNRPVVERHDDYSGLDKWREKHKRRGKPQGITLG